MNKGGKPIDPDFDGHLEHPLSSMSVAEKLHYLWEQTLFHHWAHNVVRRVDVENHQRDDSAGRFRGD